MPRPFAPRASFERLAAGAGLALAALAPSAAADEAVESILITFAAPAGCPSADDFSAQVRARTARVRIAEGGATARRFGVDLRRRGERFAGRLEIREPSGGRSVRDVSAATCEELVAALALITALAVDPQASTAAAQPLAPPPAPEPPPSPPLPPADPVALRLVAPAVTPFSAVAAPLPALLAPAPAEPPQRLRLSGGVRAGLASAVVPSVTPTTGIFVDLAIDAPDLVAPSARLTLLAASRGPTAALVGSSTFEWRAARLDGCPVRAPLGPLTLSPCLAFAAGVLDGTGSVAGIQRARSRLWLDGEVLGRATLRLDAFALEIEAGATFPLTRDTFVLGPDAVHAVPAAGAVLGLGASVPFL